MAKKTLIENASILNEGQNRRGSVLIEGESIVHLFEEKEPIPESLKKQVEERIDAEGLYLIPGMIDAHVHFREPGLTQKGDIRTESRAAVAGGVTSYMDMPNVRPLTTSRAAVEEKLSIAAADSIANYAFYLGITDENIEEALHIDPSIVCGLKLFLGSSTGNMLVRDSRLISRLMKSRLPIAVHAEDEAIIESNRKKIEASYAGRPIPICIHPVIRSTEACVRATKFIIEEAKRSGAHLHILHISTSEELELLKDRSGAERHITAETCPQYLWFDDRKYETLGARMKCNPAIKTPEDRKALLRGLSDGTIDTIGTDHAPHLLSDKEGDCLHAASGTPQIQYVIPLLFELVKQGHLQAERIPTLTAHHPADIYGISKRGYIREGYQADLVLVDPNQDTTVTSEGILSKCGWSPYEGETFTSSIVRTLVNGVTVYDRGKIIEAVFSPSQPLKFIRG